MILPILLLFLSAISAKILDDSESRLLRRNCGRFVDGYNTAKSADGDDSTFKVLNGKEVDVGAAPWAVAITLRKRGNELQQLGTGSLISPRHVITAAHLVGVSNDPAPNCDTGDLNKAYFLQQSDDFVLFVNTSCATSETCESLGRDDKFRRRDVKHIFIPKGYVGDGCPGRESYNDIAILELKEPVTFSESVWPVCLPAKADPPQPGPQRLDLFGFGRDPTDTETPYGKLKTFKSTVSPVCSQDFELAGTFCTTSISKEALSCDGDSGSGLVAIEGRKKATIVGVLSAGVDCTALHNSNAQRKAAGRKQQVEHDILIDVSQHLRFFCECCGICNNKKRR